MTNMNRYFLHLHECGTVVEDAEGLECASLAEARQLAVASARDVMIGELREGRLCLDCHIVITDGSATELARVPFRDAVVVRGR
nr:hypothetical protein [Sphingomonas deserti]